MLYENNKYFEQNIILSVLSFLFFYFVSRNLISKISQKFTVYKNLNRENQIQWIDRTNSSVHAILVIIFGCTSLYIDDIGYNNPMWGQHWITSLCLCITVGYAIYDLAFLLFVIGAKKEDYGIIIHHICMILGTGGCAIFGTLWHLWIYRSLGELSTPFLNIRLKLQMIGKKHSKLAFYNNLMFAFSFFLSRILALPYVYLLYYQYWGTKEMLSVGFYKWSFLFLIFMDVLNVYWFYLILRGFYKAIFVKKLFKKSD